VVISAATGICNYGGVLSEDTAENFTLEWVKYNPVQSLMLVSMGKDVHAIYMWVLEVRL
jgi:hypothetical protein